ncbi:MAG: hypothetical protein Q8K28_09755 [Hoeflea sp.]|uniref:hypothetical protein n=1 Tax=Hoeflea sp. TaxID=1940281 RepID=UPI00273084A8|nr:hypothetical protein [Hoeflea sp.]MDP2120175.1 hypothetical protein [Hoeflea sp.]
MTLLSICIPVSTPETALTGTVREMLASARSDFELVVGDFTGGRLADLSRLAGELHDARLRVIAPDVPAEPSQEMSACWNAMIPLARGAWISVIGAQDHLDPELAAVIEAVVKRVPDADALAWGRARYVPPALRQGQEIARIATGSRMILPEQKDLMRGRFYWDHATGLGDCHPGLWHGAVRRDLVERIRAGFSGVDVEGPAPAIDSACKTIMLARRPVFWERPLSVQGAATASSGPDAGDTDPPFADFPFSASTGAAAAAALAVEAFKRRYGIELDGWEDNFIQACVRDCETADSGERFHARKTAYSQAILAWRGKRGLAAFKPEFKRKPGIPRFQGVRDHHLHFDMAMDDTQTEADFYRLIDALLFPVQLLDDKLA